MLFILYKIMKNITKLLLEEFEGFKGYPKK